MLKTMCSRARVDVLAHPRRALVRRSGDAVAVDDVLARSRPRSAPQVLVQVAASRRRARAGHRRDDVRPAAGRTPPRSSRPRPRSGSSRRRASPPAGSPPPTGRRPTAAGRRLRGPRLDRDALEGEEAPGEARARRAKSSRSARIASSVRAPRSRGDADRLEVLRALAADADAEDHAPARDVVERGELLRDDARVAERQEDDPGADRDPLRDRRERGQRDDDVEDRVAVRDVVAGPDRVVAELLRGRAELAEACPGPGRRRRPAGRCPGSRSETVTVGTVRQACS